MGTMKRGRGKKVYDIKWEYEGQKFSVPVRLYSVHDYNTGKNSRKFCAEYPDADIDITDANSEKLEEKVIEKLKEWAQIEWVLHLVVEISGGQRTRQGGALFDVSVDYDYWAIGTHTSTGKEVMMHVPNQTELHDDGKWEGSRYASGSPQPVPENWGREKKNDSHRHFYNSSPDPKTKTVVLATPANKAALDNFMQAMQKLLDKMHTHFQPDTIAQTLQALDVLGLPAPEPKEPPAPKTPKPKKKKKKAKKRGRLRTG